MMDIEYYLQAVGSSLEGPQHHWELLPLHTKSGDHDEISLDDAHRAAARMVRSSLAEQMFPGQLARKRSTVFDQSSATKPLKGWSRLENNTVHGLTPDSINTINQFVLVSTRWRNGSRWRKGRPIRGKLKNRWPPWWPLKFEVLNRHNWETTRAELVTEYTRLLIFVFSLQSTSFLEGEISTAVRVKKAWIAGKLKVTSIIAINLSREATTFLRGCIRGKIFQLRTSTRTARWASWSYKEMYRYFS